MTKEKQIIWDMIKRRFPPEQFALLREVRDGAGFDASNSADGIAFCMYPSRGLEVHGIELKGYRGDWLKELKNPDKAEAIAKYCDRFWLITENEKVVLDASEIPVTWGWLCAKGSRLKTMKEAPKLTPQTLTKSFIAALLRRATKGLIHPSETDDIVNEKVERAAHYQKQITERAENELKELQNKIREFEQHSGISISYRWGNDPKKVGEAVKFILDGGTERIKIELTNLKTQAENIVKKLDITSLSI